MLRKVSAEIDEVGMRRIERERSGREEGSISSGATAVLQAWARRRERV